MDNNCHIPDLVHVHAFSYVENGGFNMVLYTFEHACTKSVI